MKIEFVTDFKNYKEGDHFKIEQLTVLTGKNGSGKSNFLRAFDSRDHILMIDGVPNTNLFVRHYNHTQLSYVPQNTRVSTSFSSGDIMTNQMYLEYQDIIGDKLDLELASRRLQNFASSHRKEITELTREDFVKTIATRENENIELFGFHFFDDTSTYIRYSELNKYNEFRNEKYGEKNLILSEQEFSDRFGEPPWMTLNEALANVGLKYRFVEANTNLRLGGMELKFHDLELNTKVSIVDLSPGEMIILTFITAIYDSLIANAIPEIFLFDEIDAFLHPSYSKKIMGIIETYLVKKLNKRVIIITHSPSTVAVSPDSSIFLSERINSTIKKVNKDRALAELTSEVNSLSVYHENRRQIFVEDTDDVFFHDKMFQILRLKLHQEISLNFISVTKINDEGGCGKVKNIVNELTKYGNRQISGIIDWDLRNKTTKNISVLPNRYSIENYIFDPIFLAAFFIREKIIDKKEISLSNEFRYIDFEKLTVAEIQGVVDRLIRLIFPKKNDNQKVSVKYINDFEIQIPKWFLDYRGHDLEKHILDNFPKINGTISKHKSFKHAMISDVIDELRGFISTDLYELYEKIQLKK